MRSTDILLVGNFTLDVVPEGVTPGGSVFYGGAVARALGLEVSVATALGKDFPEADLAALTPWNLQTVSVSATTSMRNVYDEEGQRHQVLYEPGGQLGLDLASTLPEAEVVFLCPVFNEIDPSLTSVVRGGLTGAGLQGWLRRADDQGRIRPCGDREFLRALSGVDVLFFSEEDVAGFPELRRAFVEAAPMVIETYGPRGARLYHRGEEQWIGGTPVDEVDPTGAGDTFAVAFLAHLARHDQPLAAAHFACGMAASVVGVAGPLPSTLLQTDDRLMRLWLTGEIL